METSLTFVQIQINIDLTPAHTAGFSWTGCTLFTSHVNICVIHVNYMKCYYTKVHSLTQKPCYTELPVVQFHNHCPLI